MSTTSDSWIEHRLIKPGTIEKREYQVALARTAMEKNTVVVLPTGLGKTTIALLVIADTLATRKQRCLFLAPTRVLVHQHYAFLQKHLQILDISMITGEADTYDRQDAWENSVICATPQITLGDMKRQMVRPEGFSLVVFDEAHRAVGDYAYCGIASFMRERDDVRLMGMTATMPSEQERAKEIVRNLGIRKIEIRDETSLDVRPYVQETSIQWIQVEMPPPLKQIRSRLVSALERRTGELRQRGILHSGSRGTSTSELIRARERVHGNWGVARILYTAIRLSHALNIFDTQGVTSFLKFCERLKEKKGAGANDLLLDPNFKSAHEMAGRAEKSGIEHPKIERLADILSGTEDRILVFTSYRDSVEVIHNKLRQMGFSAGYLIGKAGERGLKEKAQVDAVNRFRDGEFKILVATQVGEEGLDISECNLVVFYDNVPSAIRFVQRKGRTGRRSQGRVVVLMTKDTIDEAYYWISKRKMKEVKSMVGRMNRTMVEENEEEEDRSASLDSYL